MVHPAVVLVLGHSKGLETLEEVALDWRDEVSLHKAMVIYLLLPKSRPHPLAPIYCYKIWLGVGLAGDGDS